MKQLNILNKSIVKFYGETFIKADFGFVGVGCVELLCKVKVNSDGESYIPNDFITDKAFFKFAELYERKFGEFDYKDMLLSLKEYFTYEIIIQEDFGFTVEYLREAEVPCLENHVMYTAYLRDKSKEIKMNIHEMIEDVERPKQKIGESIILNKQHDDIKNFLAYGNRKDINVVAVVFNKVYAQIRQSRMPISNMK